jgi:hypothetical protein
MSAHRFRKKLLHSSSTVSVVQLRGWWVPDFGTRWQLQDILSRGIISAAGPRAELERVTAYIFVSACRALNGVNHSI